MKYLGKAKTMPGQGRENARNVEAVVCGGMDMCKGILRDLNAGCG